MATSYHRLLRCIMTAHCHRLLLLKHKEDKHTKKTTKKNQKERRELTFKLPLCPLIFGSRFYPPAFLLPFQVFFPSTLFFSNKTHTHTHRKEKNTIEKKKYASKGRSLSSNSCSTLSLLAPTSTLPLLPSCFCTSISYTFS